MSNPRLTKDSTDEEIGAILDRVRRGEFSTDFLLALLSERHAVYDERPSSKMKRIRGYAMASFAETGLPDAAISFVLDELQNGKDPFMVAGAARGLRGARRPRVEYAGFLIQAIFNLRNHDDSLDLTVFKPSWPLKNPSSGLHEILRSLAWLQGYAKAVVPELKSLLDDPESFPSETRQEIEKTIGAIEADGRDLDLSCCEIEGREVVRRSRIRRGGGTIHGIGNLEVQREDGDLQSLDEVIAQKPTVVAFFYTRCMNPNKCTLTINKLGRLQKALEGKGLLEKVNVIAFTYDPSYDTADRMRIFGENRGMVFGSNVHALRTRPEDFSILSDFFQLGVNHVGSTVNQHRLELFLLNKDGSIAVAYTRLQWELEKVVCDLENLANQAAGRNLIRVAANATQQVIFPVLLAFFPKCPACWAGYLSLLGISSFVSIPYNPLYIFPIALVMAFNLLMLYRKSGVRNGLVPFWCSFIGSAFVGTGFLISSKTVSISGAILIFAGAILNALSHRTFSKLSFLAGSLFRRIKDAILSARIVFEH